MGLSFLSDIFCGCCKSHRETHEIPEEQDNEASRLIPDSLGPTMYSNPALIDQRKRQERLGTIVRAKERQMVNVASQIPFNLHNQVLLPEGHHTLSRTASGSMDFFNHDAEDYHRERYSSQPYRQPYPPQPYPRYTTSTSPGPYEGHSRSGSPDRDSKPKTILNVRLVGFVDRRGRTMQRKKTDLDDGADSTPTVSNIHQVSSGSPTPSGVASPAKLKLQDTGAISLSWGD
ncbi:hypothetical protein Hypma_013102 [Hypsizygus marmoreus]|uniref:Uncharacterized protein n=1 Tax=Hypsizygus marmoreus TaxID=39966 RepID=A0A369JD51_HYPMA|nr:hypothetical protein Hypma_013102 [Hypsizygus marmoreus]